MPILGLHNVEYTLKTGHCVNSLHFLVNVHILEDEQGLAYIVQTICEISKPH